MIYDIGRKTIYHTYYDLTIKVTFFSYLASNIVKNMKVTSIFKGLLMMSKAKLHNFF